MVATALNVKETGVITGLVESARELRNPLTVGYSTLLTMWILVGDDLRNAAERSQLGRRLIDALASLGGAFELALATFVAAIVGSILWNGGLARSVPFLMRRPGHPDWGAFIDEARMAVRRYEQYDVVTFKGHRFGKPSSSDAKHTVPSTHWSKYLHQRVEERERKEAEITFRVTLALVVIPVALALGIEGRGHWWWAVLATPFVWADVALMKYTTLRESRRYEIQDLESKLDDLRPHFEALKTPPDYSQVTPDQKEAQERQRMEQRKKVEERIRSYETRLDALKREGARALPRFFARLEGEPPE